jgi:chemotaxis protein histidine kinase CheA
MDDRAPVADRCDLFLRDLERRLPAMEAAADALERCPGDEKAVRRIRAELHDIKGTGTPFGVPAASALARELERFLCALERVKPDDLVRLRRGMAGFQRMVERRRSGRGRGK